MIPGNPENQTMVKVILNSIDCNGNSLMEILNKKYGILKDSTRGKKKFIKRKKTLSSMKYYENEHSKLSHKKQTSWGSFYNITNSQTPSSGFRSGGSLDFGNQKISHSVKNNQRPTTSKVFRHRNRVSKLSNCTETEKQW